MPESYDGDIRLKVKIDGKDARASAKQLESEFGRIFSAIKGKNLDASFNKLLGKMRDTLAKSREVNSAIAEMEAKKIPTQAYDEVKKKIEDITNRLRGYERTKAEFEKRGLTGGESYRKTVDYIKQMQEQLKQATAEEQNLVNTGKAFTFASDSDIEKYRTLVDESAKLNSTMRAQADQANASLGKLPTRLQSIREAFSRIGDAVRRAGARVADFGRSVIRAGISRLKTMFSGATRSTNNFSQNLRRGLRYLLQYGLGISSLFVLFNKLKTATKEAFKLMVQKVPEVNKQISAMRNSIQTFKNSLATAFQPLLNIVVPIVTKIMTVLTAATTKVGEFFAALTGQKYIYKATAANQDYADSLDKTKKAADKALGSYDKLEVINKDNADSTNDATAGMGGFEKVPVSEQVQDFMQRLKDAWENGADFTWLGTLLGTKLRDALNDIDWGPIKENAKKVATALGTFINGFIKTEGLAEAIGSTLGEAINTGVLAVNTFLKVTDWTALGEFIGQGIQSAIDTIDWEEIGDTVANGANAIFSAIQGLANKIDGVDIGNKISTMINTAITGFDAKAAGKAVSDFALDLLNALNTALQNTDWESAGKKVADGIKAIKWSELISKAFEAVGSLSGAVAGFVKGLFEDLIASIKSYFTAHINEAKENGEPIARGILEGIAEGLVNIGQWIKTNIFQPFIDGFKKAFGIASPAKEMEGPGEMVSAGILEGIKSKFSLSSIKEWVSTNIFGPLKSALSTAGEAGVELFVNIKESAQNGLENIKTAWNNFKSGFNNKGEADFKVNVNSTDTGGRTKSLFDAVTGIFDKNNKSSNVRGTATEEGKTTPSGLWGTIKSIFSKDKATSNVKANATDEKGMLQTAADNIKAVFAQSGKTSSVTAKTNTKMTFKLNGKKVNADNIKKLGNGINKLSEGVVNFPKEDRKPTIKATASINDATLADNFKAPTITGHVEIDEAIPKYKTKPAGWQSAAWEAYKRAFPNYFKLADGAVIPPNHEFIAMLGDQKQGTNIETPLATMVDAFKTALRDMGGTPSSNNQPIVLQLSGKTVAEVVWDEENKRYKQTGHYGPSFA